MTIPIGDPLKTPPRSEDGSSIPFRCGPDPNPPRGVAYRFTLLHRVWPYVSIARPDHWCKNGFMLLGVILAAFCFPELISQVSWLNLGLAILATCFLASSNYVLNEILDAPTDRAHPTKRRRPIPAGQVALPWAYAEWLGLAALGLGLAALVNLPFLCSGLLLLIMGLVYNVPPIRSKEHPYVDVLSESINNPIRLLLGWFAVTATTVPPLSLLLAYWMLGAFFMAAKRLAEYRSLGDREVARAYRSSFGRYNERKLLVSMFFYAITFALFLGVFVIRYHLELILSFPLIAGFLCSYLRVAFKKGSAAQMPEKLYRERGLMTMLVLSGGVFVILMFTHIPACYEWFNIRPSPVPPLWTLGDHRLVSSP